VKLERLHERRDKLMGELRADLDRSFKDAHAQVAAVIRSLQQGGTAPDAAHARDRLRALQERAKESSREAAAEGDATAAADDAEELALGRVDWTRVRPGDRVFAKGGRAATLLALPDRRGRVRVQIGTARLEMPADQLGAAPEPREGPKPRKERPAHVRFELASADTAASSRLDLRGLRVDDALARVDRALDDAAAKGAARVSVIHGVGGGALRSAVREHLARSPYVLRFEDAEPNEGGDGVTIAILAEL
jgi:DNA mismatch repair protein MutS2